MVDDADPVGDLRGDGVPAKVGRIVGVEVVLDICTGTAGVLDDVLVAPADDDGEIAVLLDPAFGHGVECALTAPAVNRDDAVGSLRGEFAGFFENLLPLLDRGCHGRGDAPPAQKGFGGSVPAPCETAQTRRFAQVRSPLVIVSSRTRPAIISRIGHMTYAGSYDDVSEEMSADAPVTDPGASANEEVGERVLVPVTGSREHERTVQVATAIGTARSAELVFLSPVVNPTQLPLGRVPEDRLDARRGTVRTVAADVRESTGLATESVVRVGRDRCGTVAAAADEYGASTVVVRGGGEPGAGSVVTSTADGVAAKTDCDVVSITGNPPVGSVASVLLAVAGGPDSGLAATVARDLAAATDAWVDVFHVRPPDAGRRRRARVRQYVSAAQDRLSGYENHDVWVHEAEDVVEALVEQSTCYDVTVMGAPRKGRLRRLLSGSTVEDVRRDASNAVVTVRSGRD